MFRWFLKFLGVDKSEESKANLNSEKVQINPIAEQIKVTTYSYEEAGAILSNCVELGSKKIVHSI